MMNDIPEITPELLSRYQGNGPRYTSYPTVKQFHEGFDQSRYTAIARETNEDLVPRPLSLYFHMPFCGTVCYYCACSKVFTSNRSHAEKYLDYLIKEVKMQSKLYDKDRVVHQLHLGGGTPTYFTPDQIQRFMQETGNHFNLLHNDGGDYSIEIDPRQLHEDSLPRLRADGFNRVSIGLQDFDPHVQQAVNRIQSFDMTAEVIEQAREEDFHSINLDLIYGLPKQTLESFSRTLDQIIELNPDRIAIYHYAHMPNLFKVQRKIKDEDLPSSDVKLAMLNMAIHRLQKHSYAYIGMDHFAKEHDELYIAQNNHSLHRSFQGYTTHAGCDVVGMGVTAISQVGNSYSQNYSSLDEYYEALNTNNLPTRHGYRLDMDDQLRREIIMRLVCDFEVRFEEIEDIYPIEFSDYFYNEIIELLNMAQDKLLVLTNESIRILPVGRLLIRNICMVFDKYLHAELINRYSKVV